MSKKMQIQLPAPCNEGWSRMSPAEQGRFCNSCQKVVIDFTGMSDAQLVAFFKKPSSSVCGRFNKDQLERELTIPGKRMPWLKYFLQLLVPTFLFACKARTQGTPRLMGDTILIETKKDLKDKNGNNREERIDLRKIKGMVTDEKGIGIPYASIGFKGTNRGVLTDEKGNYKIDIGDMKSSVLVVASVGFNTIEIHIDSVKTADYNIRLMPVERMFEGEFVVTTSCYKERKKLRKRD